MSSRPKARARGKSRPRVRPNRNRPPAAPPAAPPVQAAPAEKNPVDRSSFAAGAQTAKVPPSNGNGLGAGLGSGADLDKALFGADEAGGAAAKVPIPAIVRGVVNSMLRDGSMVRGLQASLERIAGGPIEFDQRYAEKARVDANAEDRRYQGEKLGASGGVRNMNQTAPPLRHREFLEQLDIELERIASLIGGLDDRTKFLQYQGPSTATPDAPGREAVGSSPTNALEESLHERVLRATVIRHRLEQLHNDLRI